MWAWFSQFAQTERSTEAVDEGGWTEPTIYRVSPQEPKKPRRADIVLVHGLGGHHISTWQYNRTTYWPSWLQETIPEIRVLVASYPAPWQPFSEAPLFDNLSRGVLTALDNANVGTVPTVFICHSLGGLVVKRVLEIDADERIGGVWKQTRGIIFLSTPHGGAAIANFAEVFGNRLLDYLRDEKGEGILEEFQRRFAAKLQSRQDDTAIHVFNFYEEKNVKRIRVVDPETARRGFDFVSSAPVPANHIWMVKFHRRDNHTYIKLRRMIESWIRDETQSVLADDQVVMTVSEPEPLISSIPRTQLWNVFLIVVGALSITGVLILLGIFA